MKTFKRKKPPKKHSVTIITESPSTIFPLITKGIFRMITAMILIVAMIALMMINMAKVKMLIAVIINLMIAEYQLPQSYRQEIDNK